MRSRAVQCVREAGEFAAAGELPVRDAGACRAVSGLAPARGPWGDVRDAVGRVRSWCIEVRCGSETTVGVEAESCRPHRTASDVHASSCASVRTGPCVRAARWPISPDRYSRLAHGRGEGARAQARPGRPGGAGEGAHARRDRQRCRRARAERRSTHGRAGRSRALARRLYGADTRSRPAERATHGTRPRAQTACSAGTPWHGRVSGLRPPAAPACPRPATRSAACPRPARRSRPAPARASSRS